TKGDFGRRKNIIRSFAFEFVAAVNKGIEEFCQLAGLPFNVLSFDRNFSEAKGDFPAWSSFQDLRCPGQSLAKIICADAAVFIERAATQYQQALGGNALR